VLFPLLKPVVEVPEIVPAAALFKVVKIIPEFAVVLSFTVTLIVIVMRRLRRNRPIRIFGLGCCGGA